MENRMHLDNFILILNICSILFVIVQIMLEVKQNSRYNRITIKTGKVVAVESRYDCR